MKSLAIAFAIALLAQQPQPPLTFPPPAEQPETIDDAQDFPFLPPLQSARLIRTTRVAGPLELKSATADDEAVLAGSAHSKKSYQRTTAISSTRFVSSYRDALFAAGWKLVDVTKLDEKSTAPETVTVAAHYMSHGRNVYARATLEPDGPYEISVADVGSENWAAMLSRDCRVRVPSLHFDLDRPTLREFESEPTLEKLADLLKAKNAPAVEIQGHMDNVGQAGVAARQTLSEGRAKIVAAWLTTHGVPAAKVTAKGYGKARPMAENDSDLGRALNRRIEIARRDCTRQAADSTDYPGPQKAQITQTR
jgi:OOP family OmpA-OmpF porin